MGHMLLKKHTTYRTEQFSCTARRPAWDMIKPATVKKKLKQI